MGGEGNVSLANKEEEEDEIEDDDEEDEEEEYGVARGEGKRRGGDAMAISSNNVEISCKIRTRVPRVGEEK